MAGQICIIFSLKKEPVATKWETAKKRIAAYPPNLTSNSGAERGFSPDSTNRQAGPYIQVGTLSCSEQVCSPWDIPPASDACLRLRSRCEDLLPRAGRGGRCGVRATTWA